MLQFRGLDQNGDWLYGQGAGSYATNAAALALDIATRLRSRYGNCFFAPRDGIDYTNRLDKNQQQFLLNDISNTIMQTNGVVKINSVSFKLDPITRAMSITYNINTIFTQGFAATVANVAGQQLATPAGS